MPESENKKDGNPIVGAIAIIAFVGIAIAFFVGCSSEGGTSASSAASTTRSAPTYTAGEQAALTALHGACTEGDNKVYAEAVAANKILNDGGVHDETTLSVLQHLRDSIPEGTTAIKCAEVLANYTEMRAPS